MTSPPVEMEFPLWRFSVAVYRGGGVQEECLGVQEGCGVEKPWRASPPGEMESPLWRFSLAVYRGAGVQEECLGVQERFGVDVNLLMLCAYVGAVEGAVLAATDVADALEASGAWHGDVVRALRQVRRTMKPWGTGQGPFANTVEALR